MLSKLIGYEFKSTRRIFLPAYGVMLILALVNAIFIAMPHYTLEHIFAPFGVLMTVYFLAMFAVCVLSFAYMINRFYKNLLGDEGYLMFTLPARPSQLIWSKCITSTIWMIVTVILCSVSLLVLAAPYVAISVSSASNSTWLIWADLAKGFSNLLQEHGANLFVVPLEVIVLGIAYVINFCMHIYACLSIGSLANKHRLGFAFLAYLGFGVAKEILIMIVVSISGSFPPTDWLFAGWSSTAQMHLALLGTLIYIAICIIINFVITNYILSKHLNLQ